MGNCGTREESAVVANAQGSISMNFRDFRVFNFDL